MIEMKITIGEIEVPNKTRGMLLCLTNRNKPTKEELIIEKMVFDHIRLIGEELGKLRGADVTMVEGEGGKKHGDGIPGNHRRG